MEKKSTLRCSKSTSTLKLLPSKIELLLLNPNTWDGQILLSLDGELWFLIRKFMNNLDSFFIVLLYVQFDLFSPFFLTQFDIFLFFYCKLPGWDFNIISPASSRNRTKMVGISRFRPEPYIVISTHTCRCAHAQCYMHAYTHMCVYMYTYVYINHDSSSGQKAGILVQFRRWPSWKLRKNLVSDCAFK